MRVGYRSFAVLKGFRITLVEDYRQVAPRPSWSILGFLDPRYLSAQPGKLLSYLLYPACTTSLFRFLPRSAYEGIRKSQGLESRDITQVAAHGQFPTRPILLFVLLHPARATDTPLSRVFIPIVNDLRQ